MINILKTLKMSVREKNEMEEKRKSNICSIIRNYSKKAYLKHIIKKDHDFLLVEALKKAKKNSLEINVAAESKLLPSEEKKGRIYLHPIKEDEVDTTELLSYVAEEYPNIIERYISNRKKLKLF